MSDETTSISPLLDKLARREDLSRDEAAEAFTALMDGDLSTPQAAALLMGLRTKGERADEVAEAVAACIERARVVTLPGRTIDTCGTGGDGRCTFNCSTAVALMLAASGRTVTKHGNRSVSSSCGSADILEHLGISLDHTPESAAEAVERDNFVFFFAPNFHPAFKHVMPLRQALGIRTLFNILGPLLNPARPDHQLLGVADPALLELVAGTLALSPTISRAAVVHGMSPNGGAGYDELTPFGDNEVLYVSHEGIRRDTLAPARYRLAATDDESEADVVVSGPDEALGRMREVLAGTAGGATRKMVILNLGMCIHLYDDIPLAEAMDEAAQVYTSGEAAKRFAKHVGGNA